MQIKGQRCCAKKNTIMRAQDALGESTNPPLPNQMVCQNCADYLIGLPCQTPTSIRSFAYPRPMTRPLAKLARPLIATDVPSATWSRTSAYPQACARSAGTCPMGPPACAPARALHRHAHSRKEKPIVPTHVCGNSAHREIRRRLHRECSI